jgi:signal peptidase I
VDRPAAASDEPSTPVRPSADWGDDPVPLTVAREPAPVHRDPPASDTARRFVHAMVVFLCLFLLVRTVALEPYGVPTGSMAPALIGNHREAPCPRCDYPVVVGEPGPDARPVRFDTSRCPNCGQALDLSSAREVPGDRLMVDKTAYQTRPPRRWEVAVFRCPADPVKPYVKRVVGLPGEFIQIAGGDVYANGELCRKSLAQLREVRVPVYDMNYSPRPGGWAARWLAEPLAGPMLPANSRRGASGKPVDETILRENALYLDGVAAPEGVGLTYRHRNLDTDEEEPVGDWLGYNGGPSERRGGFARGRPEASPAHDFAVEFDLEVLAGSGAFAIRLSDGADGVRADLPIHHDPASVPGVRVARDGTDEAVDGPPGLTPGRTYRVEFAFVDRRASLALDGKEVTPPLDLPFDPPSRPRRGGMSRPLQFGVRGASVAVRNLRLYRDIHYLTVGRSDGGWRLGPDEYFLLGDNTSNSHDSRRWAIGDTPAPGVPEAEFIGKPFLIHQPLRLGRVTINGRDRVFQTLDWSRLRWLR